MLRSLEANDSVPMASSSENRSKKKKRSGSPRTDCFLLVPKTTSFEELRRRSRARADSLRNTALTAFDILRAARCSSLRQRLPLTADAPGNMCLGVKHRGQCWRCLYCGEERAGLRGALRSAPHFPRASLGPSLKHYRLTSVTGRSSRGRSLGSTGFSVPPAGHAGLAVRSGGHAAVPAGHTGLASRPGVAADLPDVLHRVANGMEAALQ